MKKESTIVSPEGALAFLFAIFALQMWYVAVFGGIHEATMLSLSLNWLILSVGALFASLINLIRGERTGNMNMLATILLGFFPGINTLITLSALAMGKPYRPVAYGIMYMIGAVFCLGAAYRRKGEPAVVFLRTVFVGVGLFFVGLGDFSASEIFMKIGGWSLFVFSMCSFYFGLTVMYPYFGFHLPQGRALFSEVRIEE